MHELAAPLLYVIRTDCETFSALRASLGQGSGDPGRSKALAELVATVPGLGENRLVGCMTHLVKQA